MIRFVAIVVLVGASAFGLVTLMARLAWIDAVPTFSVQSILTLAIFTIVIYRYLDRLNDAAMFIQIYLLSMAIKLIAYGVYVVLMILEDKAGSNANVLFFLLLYVVFTAVEVAFLHRKTAGKKPS